MRASPTDEDNSTMRTSTPLDQGWTFHKADDHVNALPASRFPTNIHLDLIHHNIIPDPNVGKCETDVQWVGEEVWTYRTSFDAPSLPEPNARVVLEFEGLDTFCHVSLNGKQLVKTQNMFVPERVDVTERLRPTNELVLTFESAWAKGKELLQGDPDHRWVCWNGDPSRLAVRKAQYHYGWDWGPKLMTCGPWRPVNLEVYLARISDLSFVMELDDTLTSVDIVATAITDGRASGLKFDLLLGDTTVASQVRHLFHDGFATTTFEVREPELWYPKGYGNQPLYTLRATLLRGDGVLDVRTKRFGIRSAKVIRRGLSSVAGRSFFFSINNIPIFCGGSNWIPADGFIPRITKASYRKLVKCAADGNQVMLRVWGGGIYEEDVFYDTCDELGILVWQDFMFACGNYPTSNLKSIENEARANVKRLRHHPSIVIWAGNNEDYQIRESEGLEYDPDELSPERWLRSNFPARYIYEKLLVDITEELVPDTHYHRGSPWGGSRTRDPTVGDIHQWGVWHAPILPYQSFSSLTGRFVSEFGMQGFPCLSTIASFIPPSSPESYAQSSTIDFHNKAVNHVRRLAIYLSTNVRYNHDPLPSYIHATQLVQSEALTYAFEAMRREWRGKGSELCGGGLVWQLNDCWPGISWSMIDYHHRPKPAYYAVKRALASLTISLTARLEENGDVGFDLWPSNLTLCAIVNVKIIVKAYNIRTGVQEWRRTISECITLPPNQTTKHGVVDQSSGGFSVERGDLSIVLAAYVINAGDDAVLARGVSWPQPLRYCLVQPAPKGLKIVVGETADESTEVVVSADVPVKGLVLEVEDDEKEGLKGARKEVWFSDNGFDVLPGEPMTVTMEGYTGGKVTAWWLNKGLSEQKPTGESRISWEFVSEDEVKG